MKLNEINIRDPFILVEDGKYYMYGTRAIYTWGDGTKYDYGFDVYVSDDLETWSEPISVFEYYDGFMGIKDYWAPEVHKYNGKFYMFASFHTDKTRGTAILASDTPDGKFTLHSDGFITPNDWYSLDGTFYEENGVPYMVFCHEWTQISNGSVCAVELSKDLKATQGEPFLLWQAGDATWKHDIGGGKGQYVTDGPFLIKRDGELISIWSSFYKGEYCEAIARSNNGSISGKWTVDSKLVFETNGGHGMVFRDLNGNDCFVFHSPNQTPLERPIIQKINLEAWFENNK